MTLDANSKRVFLSMLLVSPLYFIASILHKLLSNGSNFILVQITLKYVFKHCMYKGWAKIRPLHRDLQWSIGLYLSIKPSAFKRHIRQMCKHTLYC
jgi:hypothetical protein